MAVDDFQTLLFGRIGKSAGIISEKRSCIDTSGDFTVLIPVSGFHWPSFAWNHAIDGQRLFYVRAWVMIVRIVRWKLEISVMKVWNILRAVRSIFHCCEIEKKKKEMIRYTSLNQRVKRKRRKENIPLFNIWNIWN